MVVMLVELPSLDKCCVARVEKRVKSTHLDSGNLSLSKPTNVSVLMTETLVAHVVKFLCSSMLARIMFINEVPACSEVESPTMAIERPFISQQKFSASKASNLHAVGRHSYFSNS